jgi:hypothetical protein
MTVETRLIIGFISNLMFSSRIEPAAHALGFRLQLIEQADLLGPEMEEGDGRARRLGEPVRGRGAVLIDRISNEHPALILFDLDNAAIPWQEWLPMLKTSPATRRIPVICFGSHVEAQTLAEARQRGADLATTRSAFFGDLAGHIRRYARTADPQGLEQACREPLSEIGLKGLELFNRGEYFEAHEELEIAWNEDATPGRELYRAVLQVAVAYLQIERGNYNGAHKMFLRVRQWIDPLPDTCRGVDVARLREEARAAHAHLQALGAARVGEFDRRMLRPVHYRTG